MSSKSGLAELKYKIAWYIGTVLSFFLYFSGFVSLYTFFRKTFFKHHIAIVLMYHRVNDGGDDPDISVSTANFERQIAYLKKKYQIESLEDMLSACMRDVPMAKDTVAITFDDGFKDNFINAYPTLRKYSAPATIFMTTGWIGKDGMLSKRDIINMHGNSIAFGAHTVTHSILSEVDRKTANSQILNSKSALEEIVGEKILFFAYPRGKRRDFTEENVQMVKDAGYLAAFSTENGCISDDTDLFRLSRLGMRDFPLFVFKVRVSGIFESRAVNILRRYCGLT